jgi:acyl-CoA thioesterase FadM
MTKVSLEKMGERTLHWNCIATNASSGDLICEGRAVRIYARIQEDGNLKSHPIPEFMRKTLEELGTVKQLGGGLMTDPEHNVTKR